MNGSDDSNASKRKPHLRPQVIDASVYLLWDPDELTDMSRDDLDHYAKYGTSYARARRIQAALAEADAGGMSWRTLLLVLTDWAALAHRRASRPILSRAIEYAYRIADHGVACTDAALHELVVERENADSDDEDPADQAAFRLYRTIKLWIEAQPFITAGTADDPGMGEGAWGQAVDMLSAVTDLVGATGATAEEGTLAAAEALEECAQAMSRRIYAWSQPASKAS